MMIYVTHKCSYALYTNHEIIEGENFNSLCYCGVFREISPIIFALNVISH